METTLKLTKPICFFDLETTGVRASTDRIVEMAALKILPNGNKEMKTWRINPEFDIPEEATNVHGITNEMVKDSPTLEELGDEIVAFISGCDLGGYNSDKFDLPFLIEALTRAQIEFDFSGIRTVDVYKIFLKNEDRTLTSAYRFYCNKELENAHAAAADIEATYEVLLGQIEKYGVEGDIESINGLENKKNTLDLAGHIIINEEGVTTLSFGKHAGKELIEIVSDIGYYGWFMNSDFPTYTKKILTEYYLKNEKDS